MKTSGDNFNIITELQPRKIKSGHATIVYPRDSLSGKFVEKNPRPGTNRELWMEKVHRARAIANNLRRVNNPAYFVPKTYVSHEKVYEQMAPGETLRDGFMDKKWDFMIPAIANLLNDMSELYPIKIDMGGSIHGIYYVKSITELDDLLSDDVLRSIIAPADVELIRRAYVYLRDLPENREMVFTHNDLNEGNILVDQETGTISVIDFELATYTSRLCMFRDMEIYKYNYENGILPLWEYLDKLPRTTNPNLTWKYPTDIMNVYNTLSDVLRYVQSYFTDKNKRMLHYAADKCHQLRLYMGRVAVAHRAETNNPSIPVPLSHYSRD